MYLIMSESLSLPSKTCGKAFWFHFFFAKIKTKKGQRLTAEGVSIRLSGFFMTLPGSRKLRLFRPAAFRAEKGPHVKHAQPFSRMALFARGDCKNRIYIAWDVPERSLKYMKGRSYLRPKKMTKHHQQRQNQTLSERTHISSCFSGPCSSVAN